MNSSQQPQVNLAAVLDKSVPMSCPCGHGVFQEGIVFRKISRLVTGTLKDTVVPIPLYFCTKCFTPLNEMVPPDFREYISQHFKGSI